MYKALLIIFSIFHTTNMLGLNDFFPFGSGANDTTIIDKQNGIKLTKNLYDDNYDNIKVDHIPFFNRRNNKAVQLSITGKVVFGKIRYVDYQGRKFPVRIKKRGLNKPYQPPIIAAFWNDLSFQYNGSRFSYQIHRAGRVIEKAIKDIKHGLDVTFVPNFVLVVTWFKASKYNEPQKRFTFQMALACDYTSTYVFFHYNQLDKIDSDASIGWQEGPTNTSNIYNHKFRGGYTNYIQMLTNTNARKPGRWIYYVGEKTGLYPTVTKAPVIYATSVAYRLRLQCLTHVTRGNNNVVHVVWYNSTSHVLKSETLKDSEKISNLTEICLGSQIYCKVQTWFKNTSSIKSRFIESNAYVAGIKITPNKLSITEGGRPVNITVQVTVPIICADRTRGCFVEIGFSQSHRDIFLSRCVLKFRSNQTNTQYLTLRTKDDFVNGMNKSVIVSSVIQKVTNSYDWNCYQSKPIQVTTKNVSPGYCTVTGDPYVTTFDRVWYAFFNDGDFVLVQSTKNNFKVQIRLFKCVNDVTCACAVIVQENDDILGYNMCNRTSPRTIFKSGSLRPGTKLNKVRGTNRYFLKFASGVRINFDVEKRPGRKYPFANVAVYLPPQYHRTTVGLCGTYDGDGSNDMISKDGIKVSNEKTWPAESKFVNSWKLRNKSSLFFLRPANRRCRRAPPRTREDTLCNCEKRGSEISESCTYESVVVPPSFTQDDYQTFISAAFLKCQTRKRRTTPNNNVIVVSDEDDKSLYDYDPPDSVFVTPKWPTPTGKTKKDVEQKCMSGILNSTTGSTCSKLLKKDFDLNAFKNECISDVQISDSYDYIRSIINVMKSSCEEKILKDSSKYWNKNDNGTLVPPMEIRNIICVDDCNDNGVCKNGTCICFDGFISTDCSIRSGSIPILSSKQQYCDMLHGCTSLLVNGEDFVNSENLTCKISNYAENEEFPMVSILKAVFVSYAEVSCQLPSPALTVTYDIKVSNDGRKFSANSSRIFTYHSKCMTCRQHTCAIKNNTCLINTRCYQVSEKNPLNETEYCDPQKSNSTFTSKLQEFEESLLLLNQSLLCTDSNAHPNCMTAIKATKKLNTFFNETLVTNHIQIVLIADIISKITNYAGWSNLKEIFLDIVDILEKLLNINRLLFKEAERSKRSATIIWKSFNRITLLISQRANKTELFVSKKNFAFVLSNATHENVTITCTENLSKQMEISVSNFHQEVLNSTRVAAVVSLSSSSSEQWFYVTAFSKPSLFVIPSLETVAVKSVILSVNFPTAKKYKKQDITLKLKPIGALGSNAKVKCANWEQYSIRKTGKDSSQAKRSKQNFWSSEGCQTIAGKTSSDLVHCTCKEFSTVTLISQHKVNPADKNITTLSAITWFGTGILILALVVTIVVSSIFRRSTKLFLPFLCVLTTWLCLVVTFTFGVTKNDSEKECQIIAAILQFFLISTYCWYLVYIYLMHKSPENEYDVKALAKAATFALGVPIVVVLITATTITNSYEGNQFCVPYETAFYVGVLVPVLILFIANLYLLTLVYYHVPNGVSNANQEDQQRQQKKFQGNSSDLIKALLLLMIISVVFVTAICLIEYVSTVMEVIFLAICIISFVLIAVCFIANKICQRYKNNLEIRKTVPNVSKNRKEQSTDIRLLSWSEKIDTH